MPPQSTPFLSCLKPMKRSIADVDFKTLDLAKCLVMLSQGSKNMKKVFQCKTCNRQFPSFQALGGHRASHNRLRLSETTFKEMNDVGLDLSLKPKMHECQICSQKFSMGQALGGHMRRHRAEMVKDSRNMVFSVASTVPVLMRSNSIKRVMALDLNLTPLENDLKMLLGNMGAYK